MGTGSKPPSHMLSLTVQTSDKEEWKILWMGFAKLASELEAATSNQVNVSSVLLDDVEDFGEELRYDDGTLNRVLEALVRSGITECRAGVAINEMLNAGILFRERV